jgi:hypothetical protein
MSFSVNQIFTYKPQSNQSLPSQDASIPCAVPQSKETVLNSATASSLKLNKILEDLLKFRSLLSDLEAVKNDFEMADLLQATLDYKLPSPQDVRIEQLNEHEKQEKSEDPSKNIMVIHIDPQIIEINDDSLSNQDVNQTNIIEIDEQTVKVEATIDNLKEAAQEDVINLLDENTERLMTVRENNREEQNKDLCENEETKNNVTATENDGNDQQTSSKSDIKHRYGKKQDNGKLISFRNPHIYV